MKLKLKVNIFEIAVDKGSIRVRFVVQSGKIKSGCGIWSLFTSGEIIKSGIGRPALYYINISLGRYEYWQEWCQVK